MAGDCAVMNKDGKWRAFDCEKKAGGHCKLVASHFLSCPPGWAAFQGHCYLLQDEQLSWEEAEGLCGERGGHLASVASQAEQAELFSLLHSGPQCPQDFTLDQATGLCLWISQNKLSYDEAAAVCEETDSRLALVNGGARNSAVRALQAGGQIWVGDLSFLGYPIIQCAGRTK